MSIPSTTKEEVFERRWDGPLSDVEAPVVADFRNNKGDSVTLPSLELIHQRTVNWMENNIPPNLWKMKR
eukprot:scaffold162830_cov52-Attheya_sp.AAC.5